MSSKGEFIVKFISEAVGKGLTAPEAAKKEIDEIDKTLLESEKLKLRRMNLMEVLSHFGDDSYRRRRNVNVPTSDDITDNSPEFDEIRNKIVEAVSAKKPLNIRELIHEVGSYDQDALIMRAVKMLGEEEIVSRDNEGRVVPGKNWQ